MRITVQEVINVDEEVKTVEQLLQAGTCGATSGGCEKPLDEE